MLALNSEIVGMIVQTLSFCMLMNIYLQTNKMFPRKWRRPHQCFSLSWFCWFYVRQFFTDLQIIESRLARILFHVFVTLYLCTSSSSSSSVLVSFSWTMTTFTQTPSSSLSRFVFAFRYPQIIGVWKCENLVLIIFWPIVLVIVFYNKPRT